MSRSFEKDINYEDLIEEARQNGGPAIKKLGAVKNDCYFAVAVLPGYIQPHHHGEGGYEMFCARYGSATLYDFYDDGMVMCRTKIGLPTADGQTWSSRIAMRGHVIVPDEGGFGFLAKKRLGQEDLIPFSWAPVPDTPESKRFSAWLETAHPGDRFPG